MAVTVGAGTLVDLDHGPDLWWRFALRREPVMVLALHSWEWLAALVALGIWAAFPWWLVAVLIGYGVHLTTDHLFNGLGIRCYLLAYRGFHGFKASRLAHGDQWDFAKSYRVLEEELPFAIKLIEWWHRRSDAHDTGGSRRSVNHHRRRDEPSPADHPSAKWER